MPPAPPLLSPPPSPLSPPARSSVAPDDGIVIGGAVVVGDDVDISDVSSAISATDGGGAPMPVLVGGGLLALALLLCAGWLCRRNAGKRRGSEDIVIAVPRPERQGVVEGANARKLSLRVASALGLDVVDDPAKIGLAPDPEAAEGAEGVGGSGLPLGLRLRRSVSSLLFGANRVAPLAEERERASLVEMSVDPDPSLPSPPPPASRPPMATREEYAHEEESVLADLRATADAPRMTTPRQLSTRTSGGVGGLRI